MPTSPTLTPRAKRILAKAFAAMRAYPETVDMGDWVYHEPGRREGRPHRPAPYCGTMACFAGHMALAAVGRRPDLKLDALYEGRRLPKYLRVAEDKLGMVSCDGIALVVLGIPDEGTQRLFHLYSWPAVFRTRYEGAKTPRGLSDAVIARIRHWVRTGE